MLVYNTHGLPTLIAADNPHDRFPEIARLSAGYDLILLQEDFAHHELLQSHLPPHTIIVRGASDNEPPCLICGGSGLTLLSNLPEPNWEITTEFHAFTSCAGWLSKANDCFAQKGFQLIRLTAQDENTITIINTHLDAGDHIADRKARADQLDQIATLLEMNSSADTLIIAGDLNLNWQSQDDRDLLQAFQNRLALTRAVMGSQAKQGWVVLDYILYRSGDPATLSLENAGDDVEFNLHGTPLSDHPALFATFSIR